MPKRRSSTSSAPKAGSAKREAPVKRARTPSAVSLAIPRQRFFDDVRTILRQARQKASATVNFIMVEAYWKIGQRIVEEEQGGSQRAEYGTFLIRDLARQLGDEFGKGLSVANLWNFRQFYLLHPAAEKLYALRRELTWTHYRLVMRVENAVARDYYIQEAADHAWSSRELERQITSLSFERLLKAPKSRNGRKLAHMPSPQDLIKDPYVLEFLGLPEPGARGERGLENAIVGQGLRTKTVENETGDFGPKGGVERAALALAANRTFHGAGLEHFGR